MGTLSGRATVDTPSITLDEFSKAMQEIGGAYATPGQQTHEIVSFIAETEGQAMAGFLGLLRGLMGANAGKQVIWRYPPNVGDRREGGKIMKVCNARLRFE